MTAALLLLGRAKPSNSGWDATWELVAQLLSLQSCQDFIRRSERFHFVLLTSFLELQRRSSFTLEEASLRCLFHLTHLFKAKSLLFETILSPKEWEIYLHAPDQSLIQCLLLLTGSMVNGK